ncbi:hypothetical protein BHE90_017197 [Fusarium euwallaceae]|uniref:Uncharacterized protein n=3 Tax=Fusarium solani species complex TaxID=232080 RepID=A0A430KY48_9HYPO|nr:hypothetical protein BHE90_017197 [Fusarium euwallaceae]
MENVPSNISDFSNPESTYTAFHREHPDQQANFNRKMNETAAEFYELAFSVHMARQVALHIQVLPIFTPAPAPAPIAAVGATAATAPNPGLVAPTSIPNTNYPPVTTSYSVPMASMQNFAPIAHPQAPAATSVPQPYVMAPAQAQADTIAPTVSATVPTPITPQYTHEQAEAEREWVSVGGQWQEAFKRLSMLEIQYRSAEAPQLIAAGVRPDPSKLLSHDGSQQK